MTLEMGAQPDVDRHGSGDRDAPEVRAARCMNLQYLGHTLWSRLEPTRAITNPEEQVSRGLLGLTGITRILVHQLDSERRLDREDARGASPVRRRKACNDVVSVPNTLVLSQFANT